jgi:hypothetical protein
MFLHQEKDNDEVDLGKKGKYFRQIETKIQFFSPLHFAAPEL